MLARLEAELNLHRSVVLQRLLELEETHLRGELQKRLAAECPPDEVPCAQSS